jgi:hypothetical protein
VVLEEFAMRETDGRDEEVARQAAAARGGDHAIGPETIRLAFVSVNGVEVNTQGKPYFDFDCWNTRARSFALKAWAKLNGSQEGEDGPFLASAEEVTASR